MGPPGRSGQGGPRRAGGPGSGHPGAGPGGRRGRGAGDARALLRRGAVVQAIRPGLGRRGCLDPFEGKHLMSTFELVAAGILAAVGIRSFVVWARRPFQSRSFADHVLYALFLAGRIGVWFGLAGIALGYGLAKDDTTVQWLVIVPIVLAAVSAMSAYALGRSPPDETSRRP